MHWGFSGLPVSLLSLGPGSWAGSLFLLFHYLELSEPHFLDHGAIQLSLPPFLAGDFYLSPILFPMQHCQPGGRVNCVRVRNWGPKMSYCHSAACLPAPMS